MPRPGARIYPSLTRIAACEIIPATREGFDRALELYHQHADKGWTLTDCVSFVVLRERNVTAALTGCLLYTSLRDERRPRPGQTRQARGQARQATRPANLMGGIRPSIAAGERDVVCELSGA